MTTIMNQVTCSLCKMKINELKGVDHLVFTERLELCKNDNEKLAIRFCEMIFSTCSDKFEIFHLKIKKTLDF